MRKRDGPPDTREDEDRYQQLVELAPETILIHDGELIVLANAAAVRLAGATHRDQLIGQPIDSFLHPPYLKAVEAQLLGSDDVAKRIPPVRDAFRRLDGSEVEVEVTAIAFLDHGRPSAHLVVQDITERLSLQASARQAEEQLQQAQKMEAVGALAGGVAHEVNNMMSVILGFSEFLLGAADMTEERLSEVRHIVRAAERTAAVTRQLLAFSRRAFHLPQVVHLGHVVQEFEPVVRRLLGEERHLKVTADVSPRVRLDKGQLEQVIVNLALNARDAMQAGDTLTITTAETVLSKAGTSGDGVTIPAGRYALVLVRDTGSGMDAGTQTHVFEPFFTTTAVGKGTGLGLAAAEGIMKQNGGYITVSSTPGLGTTFTLYLPVLADVDVVERRGERRGDPLPPGPDETQAGAVILLVEDEPSVRAIAARSLQRVGFRVVAASGGGDALELMEGHAQPDLVLTDLMMPGMGGVELARRLRERWPELPVLFMSGYSMEDLVREGAIGSERGLIQKPFTPDGLVRSVAAALAKSGKGASRTAGQRDSS
ncbi:MAG: two-component system, cell cycle sensor histidine kinase and response regulator CckA [Gemmatimonadales bacterium]|nr:two-component system, cell cycle sensor histidine kinase and response regulator CckA [Gemmatimonadales bacterium]